jgi:hypothetical protein
MTKIFITVLALFVFNNANAQRKINVAGVIKMEDGKPLTKANVKLYCIGEKDTLRTISTEKGVYTFNNVSAKNAMLEISHIGYKKFADKYDFTNADDNEINNDIVMTTGDNMLETVTVESSKISIKEDTVSYRIDSTMYRKNDNVEQVLKQLPGVEVDKDGKVTAQGKEVTKVKVNGKEFFGGDVKTATRQINADMVDKIQIVDDYGDQAAFTGVKDGDPTKTLNIQLKKDKNKGVFGNGTVGVGTEKRYLGSVSLNFFNNAQQISFTSNFNNTNANLFDFSRIPGGMGAIAGGMARSFGGGGGGFGGFGNSDGVGDTKTFGINYRDDWSPAVSVNGSYSFSKKNTTTVNDIYTQNVSNNKDSSILNNQSSNDYSITDNHRFSFNVEYKIDSFNYIKFTPGVTFRKVSDDYFADFNYFNNNGITSNKGTNNNQNISRTPNYTGSLLYNHRFHKKGRTLSLNFTAGKSTTTANDDIDNQTIFYPVGGTIFNRLEQNITQDNNNHNYGMTASFNEQLTKKKALEFNYTFNRRFIGNDKEVSDIKTGTNIFIDSLSNIFENIYTTNKFGVNYRITEKKYNYSVGFAVQPATIESNSFTGRKISFKQNIINYFPVVRFAFNFSKSKSLNINYNGTNNQPTYQQSQPVADFSNRQNIVYGNPDLRPEFSNTFSMRYNNFNFITGDVLFANMNVTFIQDKIVSNVSFDKTFRGIQETRYLNTDGYYNISAFYAISKPIKSRKYVFNYGGVLNYNNNISFFNNEKNAGKNIIVTQRFSMDYKLKKWLETSGGAVFSLNDVKNSIGSNNTSIKAWSLTHTARLFFKYDFILSYDLTKTLNTGYADNVVANPFLINANIEKQIFKNKNGSIKLEVLDMLNENTNVARSVTASSITDTRTNRLQRYFMLSFIFRFNKFSGAAKGGPGMVPPDAGRGGMRMMGM